MQLPHLLLRHKYPLLILGPQLPQIYLLYLLLLLQAQLFKKTPLTPQLIYCVSVLLYLLLVLLYVLLDS